MKRKRIKRTQEAVIAAYVQAGQQFERWFRRLQAAMAKCAQYKDAMKRAAAIAEEMGFAGLVDLQVESDVYGPVPPQEDKR